MENLPAKDHSICHIRTLKLVEAQNTSSLCNIRSDHRQRIKLCTTTFLDGMELPMHSLHEIMEMYSLLLLNIRRYRIVEQVHKHCFPTANVSIHIEPLW